MSGSKTSNEDIIDELAKDLKDSLKTQEGSGDSEPFVINPNTKASDFHFETEETDNRSSTSAEVPQELDKDNQESDTESVDSNQLKEDDLKLTDDQKEENRIIAEELKKAGNDAFKEENYELSIDKYTDALRICPYKFCRDRAILYSNRAAARMKTSNYNKAIKDCTKAIKEDDSYLKAYIRRAQSFEKAEKLDESLEDYKKILEMDPSYAEARAAVVRLPKQIEERNEKLKTEMLGKLKDLGNMILKPFGLSTDNFELTQNPDSKGYSVNMKR